MPGSRNQTPDFQFGPVALPAKTNWRASYLSVAAFCISFSMPGEPILTVCFDMSFDTVWNSSGRVTDRGYVIWMAIPQQDLELPSGEVHAGTLVVWPPVETPLRQAFRT